MKKRADLYRSPYYWLEKIQNDIYQKVTSYMEEHGLNQTQLAEYLGVTRGYVSQIVNGNYNFSLKKLIDLSLKLDLVPDIHFSSIKTYTLQEEQRLNALNGEITTNFTISKNISNSKNNQKQIPIGNDINEAA